VEREILGRIVARARPVVVAAAGGVVNDPATWRMLLEESTVVWLRARPEDHWSRVIAQGDRRPMADNPDAMAELRAMLAAREPLYRQAHIQVDTSGRDPAEIAGTVAGALGRDS
jgi:XRE family aerobic/anaerobic benzoate catabolism transcriptional regulator